MYVVKMARFQKYSPLSVAEINPLCAFLYRRDAINYLCQYAKTNFIDFSQNRDYGNRTIFFELGRGGTVVAITNDVQATVLSFGTQCGVTDLSLEPQDVPYAADAIYNHLESCIGSSGVRVFDPITLTSDSWVSTMRTSSKTPSPSSNPRSAPQTRSQLRLAPSLSTTIPLGFPLP
jgi:hypothetical protein